MNLRALARSAATLLVLAGLVIGAAFTRDRWLPYVFPEKGEAAKAEPEGDHGHDHGSRDDRVKLSPQAQRNLKLEVDTPTPREYWRTMLIPGTVVDRPGESDRGVISKVAGVVTAIMARPGDTVKGGDPLFTLQLASEFLQSAQTDLVKTAKELELAVAERDIVANLVKRGTKAEAELLKQQGVVTRLTTQLNGVRRQLQLFGFTPAHVDRVEKGEIITELQVAAPPPAAGLAAFEVQELKVSLGEQVQAGQTLCLLSNHQKLYVEGRAFKSEAGALADAIRNRTPIRAEFADEAPGAWPPQAPLAIHHLANQVDSATRTFSVFLTLENQPLSFEQDGKTHFIWRYRPGQRVRLRVPVEKFVVPSEDGKPAALPFVFPAAAVVREGPETFVFVQSGDVFLRKAVRLLHVDRSDAVVANDGSVTEADFVVMNQAAAINRALKSQAAGGHEGHGHSHDH